MQVRYIYEQSTQYKHWRFTKAELKRLRESINHEGIERAKISRKLETKLKQEQKQENEQESKPEIEDVEYISPEEEKLMVGFYETKIKDYVKVYRFNKNINSTAIMYLKRFYLCNTVLDYHPKQIMLTCLFLATKVENFYLSIESFTKPLKQISAEDVLMFELLVSQSLRFDLAVSNPFNSAYGYFLDLQGYFDDNSVLTKTYTLVVSLIESSLFTDCGLIYMPSQIALAAWKAAADSSGLDFDLYLTKKFPAELLKKLYPILDEVQLAIKEYSVPDIKLIREIDKKLIYCRNQAKNPNSIVYKHLMEKAEEESILKKQKKREKQKADEDIFS